jgi:raffinose/stachyose/melibiose transport system permease protein
MSAVTRRKRRLSSLVLQALAITICGVVLYPFAIMFFSAFKDNTEIYMNPTGLPIRWVVTNFTGAWEEAHLGRLYVNSIFITSSCVLISLFASSVAGYAFCKSFSKYSKVFFLIFTVGLFIPSQLSVIPLFRIVKILHLGNSYIAVILVYVAGATPLGVMMFTTFMRGLPKEMAEAATIDGCGYFKVYRRIYMPLVGGVAATFGILQAIIAWNDFLIPYLLLTDANKRTLTTGIMMFKQQYTANWGYLMAGIVMMVMPIIIVYLFLQKYVMKGLTAGAVKA